PNGRRHHRRDARRRWRSRSSRRFGQDVLSHFRSDAEPPGDRQRPRRHSNGAQRSLEEANGSENRGDQARPRPRRPVAALPDCEARPGADDAMKKITPEDLRVLTDQTADEADRAESLIRLTHWERGKYDYLEPTIAGLLRDPSALVRG